MTGPVLAALTDAERAELRARLAGAVTAVAKLARWSAPSAELWSHAQAVQIELAELHSELCEPGVTGAVRFQRVGSAGLAYEVSLDGEPAGHVRRVRGVWSYSTGDMAFRPAGARREDAAAALLAGARQEREP